MDDSFHVPAAAKSEFTANLFVVALFTAFAAGEIAFGIEWAFGFFALAALGSAWSAWRARRLARRGIVFDAAGLGPAEDGVRLWTLPWSEYAGVRPSRATLLERIWHPERDGYEVLTHGGAPGFVVQLPQKNPTLAAFRAARQELRRHLPPGAPDPFAPISRPPQHWVVALGLLVALAGGAAARIGLANPLSPLLFLGLVGAFSGLGGALIALFETVSLLRWARGWRPSPVSVPEDPEEGPRGAIHAARYATAPIRLEEGRRYRAVDPERTRESLRYEASLMRGTARVFGTLALVSLLLTALDLQHGLIGLAFALGLGLFALLCVTAPTGLREREARLDDTLWVQDGHLVVVRPESEPLTLPLPTASDRQALRRKARTNTTDVWRLPNGKRYAIDRTRLYATDLPEEL